MGIRINNVGNLFRDTRSRVIIIITGILVLIAVIIGWWKFRAGPGLPAVVTVGRVPHIQSIPGSLNPTEQYAKLQLEQNIEQAKSAKQTGGSAIPTIIRTELFSAGQPPVSQEGGLPYNVLARKLREGGVTKGLWFDELKNSKCAKDAIEKAQEQGATLDLLKEAGCTAKQLVASGHNLPTLKQAGFTATDLKDAGFTPIQLRGAGFDAAELRKANFSACDTRNAGFTADDLKRAGYSDGELLGAGFEPSVIQAAGGLPIGLTTQQVRSAGCSPEALRNLRKQGVGASTIRQVSSCSADALRKAGFTPTDLKLAGYTADDLRAAGYPASELKAAGFGPKQLRDAGYAAKELKDAGFPINDLKAGGYSARDLRLAGATPRELQQAGFTANELKNAGVGDGDIANAGYTSGELNAAGIGATQPMRRPQTAAATPEETELQRIMRQQEAQMSQQQYQQQLQNRYSVISQHVTSLLGAWSVVPTQTFVAGTAPLQQTLTRAQLAAEERRLGLESAGGPAAIKAGDILYAVLDTAVNTDEPSPVLATIVQGKLKGGKLIGSLRFPQNAERVIISFNLLSLKDAPATIPINAVAIDPDTARTALSSDTDYHYLSRYGSLFVAAFLDGWGRGVENSATTVTITPNSSTFQTDQRSTSQLAQIAGGRVGQAWGRLAQRNAERRPTVQVYSGTGVGVLFLQDLPSLPGITPKGLVH